MKFREIVESPCGIRYLFDELRLQSGFARKVLLDREMMTDAAQIDAAYARLRDFIAQVKSDRRHIEDIRFRLQGLREITGTLGSLAEGAMLDEIELFEITDLLAEKVFVNLKISVQVLSEGFKLRSIVVFVERRILAKDHG